MAVTSIADYLPGWGGTDTTTIKQFTVTNDNKTDSAAVVIDSPLTPKVNDRLDDNNQYVILPGGIQVTRIDDKPYQWRMTAVYTKTGFSFNSSDDSDRLIAFGTSTRNYTRTPGGAWESYNPITKATITTNADTPEVYIRNSAGDTFDPADIQEEYYNTVINFTQREGRNFDYIGAIDNKGSVNKEKTTIFGIKVAEGRGLMRAINPELSADENGDFEWICSYSVELADDNDFWINVLDRGFYAIIDGAKKEITNADIKRNRGETPNATDEKTYASEPQLLDGRGGLRAWNPSTEQYDPVYLRFRTKKYKDWEKTLDIISEEIRTR